MASVESFAQAVSHKSNVSVAETVVLSAWFLEETNKSPTPFTKAMRFVESNGIRLSVSKNQKRTRFQISRIPNVSIDRNGLVRIGLKLRDELRTEYGRHISAPPIKIEDLVLDCDDFRDESKLIKKLCTEINATYQVQAFNACSVVMRRLMEILIIKAFKKNGSVQEIQQDQEYLSLEAIIKGAASTNSLKFSRGIVATMKACKKIGDKGAHSTTYDVKEIDIAGLSTDYRAMIADLLAQ